MKGFTLIELMIVVAIIGILASVAVPLFSDDDELLQPEPKPNFEQFVDDDCVRKYGEFACGK